MLETQNLQKVYRSGNVDLTVLRGISLRIERGAFVSITGPSGAGKSTLLHVLAGLDTPTAGEVLWEDQPLSRMSETQRAVFRNRTAGIVFQFYHLLPELTALENVMLPGFMNGHHTRGALKERALVCLDQVRLKQRSTHKPSQLSGGELQRAAIARALVTEPQVLFWDEPTGNLDSNTGSEIADLLVNLHKQRGMSLVLVTRELELATRADHQIVLRDGHIVTETPVS